MQAILSWETSLLARSGIVGVFGNALTVDHVYSRHYLREISATYSNAIISKTKNIFSIFFLFLQFTQKFVHFEKNINFIASIFRKSLCPKNVVTSKPESSSF